MILKALFLLLGATLWWLSHPPSAEGASLYPNDCRGTAEWVYDWDEPFRDCVPWEFAVYSPIVMGCESSYKSDAIGIYGERGLLQTHPVHYQRDELCEGLQHTWARGQATCAVRLYRLRGWQPWASSKGCHGR